MKSTLILFAFCVASCVGEWPSALRAKRQRYEVSSAALANTGRYPPASPGKMVNPSFLGAAVRGLLDIIRDEYGATAVNNYKRELPPPSGGTDLLGIPIGELEEPQEPRLERVWHTLVEIFTNFRSALKEIRHSLSGIAKRVMRHVMK